MIPAGATIKFALVLLHGSGLGKQTLQDCLEYGLFMGLGQWRSGGWGSFEVVTFKEIPWETIQRMMKENARILGLSEKPEEDEEEEDFWP